MWYSDNYNFKTSLKFRIEAKTHLSLHEVQVSYSYSASYVIVTMSHNFTSLKQLLLFLQYFKWREYEAPSTTVVFRLCSCLSKHIVVLVSDWSTQFISLSPETTIGIWTKPYGNHRLLKCVYISGKSIHKYGRLGLWLSDVFQTSALKLLHGFQQNFTGSK